MNKFAKISLIILLTVFVLPNPVSAFEINDIEEVGTGDILVTPAKVEVALNQGETKNFKITVSNRLSARQSFKVEVADILPSLDPEEVLKIKENELSDYINFITPEIKTFDLLPNQSITFSVHVAIPSNASSGGYHFSILVTAYDENLSGPAVLRSRVGVVTLLKVGGDTLESGELAAFKTRDDKNFFLKAPIETFVSFENTGNVHLNPYGGYTVKNMFGETTETYELKPWFVLPTQTRSVPLPSIETDWKFGFYTMSLELNRGYENVIDRSSIKIFVLSWQWLCITLIISLILVGVIARASKYKRGEPGRGVWFYLYILVLVAALALVLASSVLAGRATSTNYILERDSVNIGGEYSTSTNYRAEDTLGEVATGRATSTTYILNAGYQQLSASYISISSPSDVSLSPNIHPTNGGQSDGSATWTVITNSANGYSLSIKASQSPAMDQISGSDSFADYTPAGASPDYDWAVSSGVYEFGYSPNGSNISSRWKNNGSACNVGSTITNLKCWDKHTTSNVLIASAASGNHPSGANTVVNFRAESNAGSPSGGDYQATLTLTAVAL